MSKNVHEVGVVKFFWMHFYLTGKSGIFYRVETGPVELAEKEKIIFLRHFHTTHFSFSLLIFHFSCPLDPKIGSAPPI